MKSKHTLKNSIVLLCSEIAQNPKILGEMYNNQLMTKALLLNASNKWKRRIKNSGDTKLFTNYVKWENDKAYLAKMYHEGNEENREKIKELELKLNNQEKKLSIEAERYGTSLDNKIVKWQEIRDILKKG